MSTNTAALPARRGNSKSSNSSPIILTLVGIIAGIVLRIRAHRARKADRALLYSMSDGALKDIRLCRCDIERITCSE